MTFPINPTLGQEYSFEGRTWVFNGKGWQVKTSAFSIDDLLSDINTILTSI